MPFQNTIKVTVEKGHLLTLGERMYVESIELVRELVNNAYDADATDVYVTLSPTSIVIEDNGSGMNESGLAQFFTIGSEEKRTHSISPRFGRKRIGQFGIGKFAALAAAERFVVESKKGDWIYSVIFDREDWRSRMGWELPIIKERATPLHHEGTKITLSKLKKQFTASDIERHLKDTVPLRARRFSIYVNGKKISARYIPGRHFPININTIYGKIEGELTLAARADLVDKAGISCRVKQVLIKRELFDLERTHAFGLSRITGDVNADFLPVIGSRDDFLRDSNEFQFFYQVVRVKLEKILKDLKKEADSKKLQKIQAELREALNKLKGALELHPEFAPTGRTITQKKKKRRGLVVGSTGPDIEARTKMVATKENNMIRESRKEARETVKQVAPKPKPEVIKRIKLNKIGVSVAVAQLGAESAEVTSNGNLIYVNSDHPLYNKLYNHKDQFEFNLLRLITQEIVTMRKSRVNSIEAFSAQSQLLTDALCDRKVPAGEKDSNAL